MSGFRDRIWGTGKQATQEEVVELTNQFYVTLRAYFAQIRRTGAADDIRNKDALARIKVLLEGHDGEPPIQNWTNAYEVEQLFVHLYDDDTIATELRVRLLEARSILRPELAAMYDATVHDIESPPAGTSPAATAVRRRSVLARLVNDLQWRYIVNEAKRRYSKLITRRTATLSVIALIVFVAVVLFVVIRIDPFRYSDLRLLWIAALAGTWGATFSMLASLKTRLDQSRFDDLKLMKSGSVLLSRAAIGAGAASILFFFLMSGLLGGTAFPVLTKSEELRQIAAGDTATPSTSTPTPTPTPTSSQPSTPASTSVPPAPTPPAGTSPPPPAPTPAGTISDTPPARTAATDTTPRSRAAGQDNLLPTRELAMLIVWCFLAGFSEQLIPGLLASTEARIGAAPGATDRFRPTTGTTTVPPVPGGSPQAANPASGGGAQQPPAPKGPEPPKT